MKKFLIGALMLGMTSVVFAQAVKPAPSGGAAGGGASEAAAGDLGVGAAVGVGVTVVAVIATSSSSTTGTTGTTGTQ